MLSNKFNKQLIAFLLIFTLGTMILQINQFIGIVHAQSNTWYVGKGVKPDTYYTYEITSADTNQGQPFSNDYLF